MMFNKETDTILVTGCNGFLGGRELYKMKEKGYKKVIGSDVTEEPLFKIPEGYEWRQGDITDKDNVKQMLKDIKAVINNAAIFNFSADPNLLKKVNVEGVMNLFHEGELNGLEYLIQTSSGTVYAGGKLLEEQSKLGPIEPYGKSKLECEKQIALNCNPILTDKHSAPKVAIVRPAVIYGPLFPNGSRYGGTVALFSQYLIASLLSGLTATPNDGKVEACYVHVDDVINSHLFVLENRLFNGVYLNYDPNKDFLANISFNIVDQTPVTHKQLAQIVLSALDLPWYRRILAGKSISLPEKPVRKVSRYYDKLMNFFKDKGINLPDWLASGNIGYMYTRDFSMNPKKLVSYGFVHEHPSSFYSMPEVIKEYAEEGWAHIVGNRASKLIKIIGA